MKDDGAYGSVYGGNKVRKLEWILPDAAARGRRTIVTVGALGTNHGLATALYARERGMRCAVALVDQPVDDHVRRQLARLERSGARLYKTHGRCRTYAAAPWIMLRHADLRRLRLPYFLTVGGSTPVGCVGFVEAALELAEQVEAGALPEPSHVVVALGSGGTAAGLAAGLRLAGLRTRVVGIVVNDRTPVSAPVVAKLANRTLRPAARARRARAGMRSSPATSTRRPPGSAPATAIRTPEAERTRAAAAAQEGLELDPVYTAKAMAGLLALREQGRFGDGPVLFWQSHDTMGSAAARSRAAARAAAGPGRGRGSAAPGRAARVRGCGSGTGGPGRGGGRSDAPAGGSGSGTGGGLSARGSAGGVGSGTRRWARGPAGRRRDRAGSRASCTSQGYPASRIHEPRERRLAAAGDRRRRGRAPSVSKSWLQQVAQRVARPRLTPSGSSPITRRARSQAPYRASSRRCRRAPSRRRRGVTCSAVSSGQMTPTSRATIPSATSSPNAKPCTSGPPSNSCRPASWQSTGHPQRRGQALAVAVGGGGS